MFKCKIKDAVLAITMNQITTDAFTSLISDLTSLMHLSFYPITFSFHHQFSVKSLSLKKATTKENHEQSFFISGLVGNTFELEGMASPPIDDNIFSVDDFDKLNEIRHKLFEGVCESKYNIRWHMFVQRTLKDALDN